MRCLARIMLLIDRTHFFTLVDRPFPPFPNVRCQSSRFNQGRQFLRLLLPGRNSLDVAVPYRKSSFGRFSAKLLGQMQNKSHAVMAQRIEPADSLDDFPTPPWATRALIEHVFQEETQFLASLTCLEPACGAGHMAKVLAEYFKAITCCDICDYGFGQQRDYLKSPPYAIGSWDWVITNPPFRLAEEFVLRSLDVARIGVAILARTVFIESVGRYERLFKSRPPTTYAQFTERVPMVKGRLDKNATTATSYCWLVWKKTVAVDAPKLVWIPPCRKKMERNDDYNAPIAVLKNDHSLQHL